MRIESSSPGAEWTQIAQVVKSGGSVTITDQREFYFEGAVTGAYAGTWGAGNDRDNDVSFDFLQPILLHFMVLSG